MDILRFLFEIGYTKVVIFFYKLFMHKIVAPKKGDCAYKADAASP